MLAVVFDKPGSMGVREVPEPEPGPGEVLIRVSRAGLCGTDVHIYRGEYPSPLPLTPGHEFCGTVAKLGADVAGLSEGERVTADPNLDCGQCEFCRQQLNNHCENWQAIGVTLPGALAEYVVVPARVCYALPDAIDDQAGALVEPLACVVHAMNRIDLSVGRSALLFGAGPMGLLLVQTLRQAGAAEVVVVEKQPGRLELAGELGADRTIAADGGEHEQLRELRPRGFDLVVDATGVPAVIERALGHLRPGGQYLQFGVAPTEATIHLKPFELFRYDWTLVGSFAVRYTFEQAIALLGTGTLRTQPLVSHTVGLDEFAAGFERFAAGRSLKVQVGFADS